MKTSIHTFFLASAVLCLLTSCSDCSFSKTGIEFLESAFGSSRSTAKSLLSDDIEVGIGNHDNLSKNELKELFLDYYIDDIKYGEDIPGPFSDFVFRCGFSSTFFGTETADGYFSYGDQKDWYILVEFTKESNEWLVDGIEVCKIGTLIDEYKKDVERLKDYKNSEENAKMYKEYIKQDKKLIKSFKSFFSDEQLKEISQIK